MGYRSINFSYAGRYFVTGDLAQAEAVWFVLHGYGQLAEFFIRKFQVLQDYKIAVIAPEGLSQFYLEETAKRMHSGNNRVGASWMTKENRLADIENYLNFLNSIYSSEIISKDIPITILGFSQGAATATRWALDGKINFETFILWSGVFPGDINFETGHETLKNKKTFIVYGDQDPFINDQRFTDMKSLSEKLKIDPTVFQFAGGHDIDKVTLLKLIS